MADITYKKLNSRFLYEAKTDRGFESLRKIRVAPSGIVYVDFYSNSLVLETLRKYCTVAKYKEPSLQDAYAAAGKIFEGG